jgi:hypothetical protein
MNKLLKEDKQERAEQEKKRPETRRMEVATVGGKWKTANGRLEEGLTVRWEWGEGGGWVR